jgi:sugar lactone lactonase YvrE
MSTSPRTIYDGLRFPEGARWHRGHLWFSDMHTGEVFEADAANGRTPRLAVQIDDQPSGLGWLADGSMLVSSMLKRQVVRLNAAGDQDVFADLSSLTDAPTNDLVVDDISGNVYLGGFGYDLYASAEMRPGPVFTISESGAARTAVEDLIFPNGCVILPGTRTLVVAETWAARLTAFEIGDDGALSGRRTWVDLPEGATPDGLCADLEGGVWVSDIANGRFLRTTTSDGVTDVIDLGQRCAADCVLGGEDGRTLFLLTSNSWIPDETHVRAGRVEAISVAVPGPTSAI